MPSMVASRPPSIFYGLIWKESMQLLPLLFALIGMSTLLHVILGLIPGGKAAYPGFLILVPNLFALGAPPMAIGQEEETGTLRWMRGLPIDWRWIASVKASVAVAGLCLSWLFSLAIITVADRANVFGGSEIFSIQAIGGFAYACAFSLYLMSCGFAVSWWLRSPIASLLTMLPLMIILFFCTVVVGNLLVDRADFSTAHTAILFALAAILTVIAAVAAWRTLSRPLVRRRTRRWNAVSSAVQHAYQPVSIVPLQSPGRHAALLWQACAQTWLVVLPLFWVGFASAMIAILVYVASPRGHLPPASFSIGLLVTSFLGAMVFVTDNKNRRHRFLADRGLAPFTIWWTRQAVPLLAALVIAGIFFALYAIAETGLTGLLTLLLFAAAFASGQLTGQAFRRPIVGLLAAPVAFVACGVVAGFVLALYPSYTWAGVGAIVLLWLVTLRLCRRWSEERIDAGYYGRLAGWIGLAALAFFGSIAVVRYATTPPAIPGWHEKTLALAKRTVAVEGSGSYLLQADLPRRQDSSSGERLYTVDELRETAEKVIDDERVGLGHQARAESARILEWLRAATRDNRRTTDEQGSSPLSSEGETSPSKAFQAWLEAMLLTSRRMYQSAGSDWNQLTVGEGLEAIAIDEMLRHENREVLGASEWEQLVSLVPTPAERAQWRKDYLLRGWLAYYREPQYVPFFPLAGGTSPAVMRRSIPAEQWRTGRFLDRAVRLSLSQLDEGLPAKGSPEEARRLQAWQALRDDEYPQHEPSYRSEIIVPTSQWNSALEQKAERLALRAESQDYE